MGQSDNDKGKSYDNQRKMKAIEATNSKEQFQLVKVVFLSLFLPFTYLYIDGQDWTSTFLNTAILIKDITIHLPSLSSIESFQQADTNQNWGIILEDTKDLFYLLSTYLLRHVYIYYGLTKWLVQWDKRLFDLEGSNDIYSNK